jgi:hypothetical protein
MAGGGGAEQREEFEVETEGREKIKQKRGNRKGKIIAGGRQ